MRERIYAMVQKSSRDDKLAVFYNFFIVAVAFLSILPLMFKTQYYFFTIIDIITVYILFADYVFRWITYDFATKETGAKPFVKYPFTPFALLDLLSLLPSMGLVGQSFRILRMFRIFKIFRYSKNFRSIAKVLQNEKKTLISVLMIAVFYIFISALAMFSYEPDTFSSFFEACYWATTALTTVGYGDVYPVSDIGRLISMISSLFGIAVVALPAGIVTAGFLDMMHDGKLDDEPETKTVASRPFNSENIIRHAIVIPVGILMNYFFALLGDYLNLPVWLDVSGTAYAALILGPTAGLLVGLINNFYLAIFTFGTSTLFYYAVSACVAIIAGLCLKKDSKFQPSRIIPAILLTMVSSALISSIVDIWVNKGAPPNSYWENFYYAIAVNANVPHLLSYFAGEISVKVFDTIAVAIIVAVFYFITPKYLKHGRPLEYME